MPDILASLFNKAQKLEGDNAGSGGMKALDLWRSMAVNLDEISANTAGINVNTRSVGVSTSVTDGKSNVPGADGTGRARRKSRGKRRNRTEDTAAETGRPREGDGGASPARRKNRRNRPENSSVTRRPDSSGTASATKAATNAGKAVERPKAGKAVERNAKTIADAVARKTAAAGQGKETVRLPNRGTGKAEATAQTPREQRKRTATANAAKGVEDTERKRDASGRFIARNAAERAAADAKAKKDREGLAGAIAKGFNKAGKALSSLTGRSGGQAGNVLGSVILGPLQGAFGEATGVARDVAGEGEKAVSLISKIGSKTDKNADSEERANRTGNAKSDEINRLLKKESSEIESQGNLASREAVNAKKRHQEILRAVKQAGKGSLAGRAASGLRDLFSRRPKVKISAGRGGLSLPSVGKGRAATPKGQKKPSLFGRGATATTAAGKGLFARGAGAVGRTAGAVGRGAGLIGRGALAALGPLGAAIGIGFAAKDGISGWNQAGDYFGKSQEDATTGEKVSSAAANILNMGGLLTDLASNLMGVNVTTGDVARSLHDFGSTVADGAVSIGQDVLNFAKGILPDDTKQALQDACTWAVTAFTDAKDAATGFAEAMGGKIKELAGEAWEGAKDLAGKAWDKAKGAVSGAGELVGKAWDGAKGAASSIGDTAGRAWEGAKETAGKAWEGTKNTVSRGWHSLKGLFTSSPEKKPEAGTAPAAATAGRGTSPTTTAVTATTTATTLAAAPAKAQESAKSPIGTAPAQTVTTIPAAATIPATAQNVIPSPAKEEQGAPAASAEKTAAKAAPKPAAGRSAEEILEGIASTLTEIADGQGPIAHDVHTLSDDFAVVFNPEAVRNTRMLQELMAMNGTLAPNQLNGANSAPYTPGGAGIVPQGSSGYLPTGTATRTADAKMGSELKAKVVAAAQAKGINPDLALALIQQESGGNVNSTMHNTNGTTDWGLMQVNDAVIADYNRKHGTNLDPRHNVNDNITVGMDELAGHLQKWGGDVDKALLAYNRGDGGANSWLRSGKSAQDNDYVRKVRSYMSAGTPAPIPAAMGIPPVGSVPPVSGPASAMSGAVGALTDNAMSRRVGYGYGSKNSASGAIDCSGWVSETNGKIFSTMGERGRYANAVMRGSMLQGSERDYAGTAAGIVLSVSRANGHLMQGEELAPQNMREGIAIGVAAENAKPDQKGRFNGISHIVQTYRDPQTGQLMVTESRGGGVGVTKTPYEQWYRDNVIRKHRAIFGADMMALAGQGAAAPVGGAQQPVDPMQIVAGARGLSAPAAMATGMPSGMGSAPVLPIAAQGATAGSAGNYVPPVSATQTASGAAMRPPVASTVPQVSTIAQQAGAGMPVSMTGTETLLRAIFDLLKGHFAFLERDTGRRQVAPPTGPGGAQIPTGYGDADLQAFAQDRA